MRLIKLSIQRFQCIETAEVEFGPGLNVLFGPNDLGKSSLAWAIRAVLLLQHNSSYHERFVSWYGGGEPQVSLTFTDAGNRYWRVTKTFGGSAGRSLLETSMDGRTFSSDCNGRQVDEKLRKLLGWGIQAPAGTGGARGFPDSFLAQVPLSEQDSVRKVLFDTSLTKDPDESGRRRLTEALGALAQDPLFKKVLDNAKVHVDRAFTPTGRKKKAAGSPFLEITERIKGMGRERDELEAKVRDTVAAEQKIRELIEHRDLTSRKLDEARTTLAQLQAGLIVTQRSGALRVQIIAHRAQLETAETLQRQIAEAQIEVEALQRRAELTATELQELMATAATDAAAKAVARQMLDAITVDGGASDLKRTELEEQRRTTQEQFHDAERALERANQALRSARAAADNVAAGAAEILPLAAASQAADAVQHEAANVEIRAQETLEQAKQRLRDATSGDQARARELRRTELDNRRLSRTTDRTKAITLLQRISEVQALVARAIAAQATCHSLSTGLSMARDTVASTELEFAELDTSAEWLQLLQRFGQLRTARNSVAIAAAAAGRAEEERSLAVSLRSKEANLRATLSEALPTANQVAELRRMRDELRVAEARLGGGLSITIRPRRELTLSATCDGVAEAPQTTRELITLSSVRLLSLAIDELVDLEITAGEEEVRTLATELRARWSAEGESLLRSHGVETVEALELRLADAETSIRAADEYRRNANAAEQRAAQHGGSVDPDALAARVTELEAAIGAADQAALTCQLDKLGASWEAALQQSCASIARSRKACADRLAQARQQLARAEALLESEMRGTSRLVEEADSKKAELADEPAKLGVRVNKELAAVERDLQDIEQQRMVLSQAASSDAAISLEVEAAEQALATATADRQATTAVATAARNALLQAQARLDMTRTHARELDREGAWAAALENGAPLTITRWTEVQAQAERRRDDMKTTCTELQQKLNDLARARSQAIQEARDAVKGAKTTAVASQDRVSVATVEHQHCLSDVSAKRLALAEMKTMLAGTHLEAARAAITALQKELDSLAGASDVDQADVDAHQLQTTRLETNVREAEDELARARGALEQVGGAIVRERQHELTQAIERETKREHQVEVEYDAWKLLVDTMRESESTEGAHLGLALAGPVSQRFRDLTGGRYKGLELSADLKADGIEVAGGLRDISALSAGTQDQLATLIRLCIAEQVRSGLVLDDHLSQSDPKRVSWFNSILRGAAHQIQIVFITCRPLDILTDSELPTAVEAMKISTADQLRAIDLSKAIRRFAAS